MRVMTMRRIVKRVEQERQAIEAQTPLDRGAPAGLRNLVKANA
jgi:hypothetical protein